MRYCSTSGRRLLGRRPFFMMFFVVCALSACKQPDSVRVERTTGVLDSILPIDEAIRRFTVAIPPDIRRDTFIDVTESRDALVTAFMQSLATRDTARLRALLLTPAEFITAYYPASVYTRPPYRQSPALVWFLMQENSAKGIHRALARFGGQSNQPFTYSCDAAPRRAGPNRLWQHCIIEWPLDPVRITLFGTIIERAGRFKFVSYANDL